MAEEKIGTVANYFAKVGVAAITITEGSLKVGDRVQFKGSTTDFEQSIDSMQVEHQEVQEAQTGDSVGLKAKERVRKGDTVYRVTD